MRLSLKFKSSCYVLLIALVIGCTAAWLSYRVYSDTMDSHYRTMTMNLAKTEAVTLDCRLTARITEEVLAVYREICGETGEAPDFDSFAEEDWDRYYAAYDRIVDTEPFQKLINQLRDMAAVNDVKSIYICYMDEKTRKAVYIVDSSLSNDACRPGTCDNIEEKNLSLMQQGIHDFPAYITNYEEYGWLCSASAGIYGEDGNLIANAYVDISMGDVMRDRQGFMLRLCLTLVVVTCILTAVFLLAIHKTVVSPINSLAYATSSFVSEKENHGSSEKSAIEKLQIHTRDEIEKLAGSIQTMEKEINTYIDNLTTVTAEKERIGAELNVATQIQADMLPNIFPAFPDHDEFDIYATMTPAKEVGGDFYDFFMVDDTHLAIVMADVSGKGVPVALFMVIAKTLIKNHAQNKETPAQVFTNVNSQLCENNEVGMFVTGWMGVMDILSGHMVYANAGHNYPLIIRKNGTLEWVKSRPGFVLAGMEGVRYRQNELQLEEGDMIYLYTDGVTEALNPSQELFGEARLEQALSDADMGMLRPEKMLRSVEMKLKDFAGEAEQADDITMLALYRNRRDEKAENVWNEIRVRAKKEEWDGVSRFLEGQLEKADCKIGIQTQILIAAEEIFINIASYAYGEKEGDVEIKTRLGKDGCFQICFEDRSIPYDPLKKPDPDITLSAEERGIGGLGILMVKKSMDDVRYEYLEGANCLTLCKNLGV